jgi:anthranilate phosphoribosyltransferase
MILISWKCTDKAEFVFYTRRYFTLAMKMWDQLEKRIKCKNILQYVGPMVNPSFPQNQLVGVSNLE